LSPESFILTPVTSDQYRVSSIEHPETSYQYPATSIEYPASSIQKPATSTQQPVTTASSIQHLPSIFRIPHSDFRIQMIPLFGNHF
jgi:hypothetical protein